VVVVLLVLVPVSISDPAILGGDSVTRDIPLLTFSLLGRIPLLLMKYVRGTFSKKLLEGPNCFLGLQIEYAIV
jgi:hypothetical protein